MLTVLTVSLTKAKLVTPRSEFAGQGESRGVKGQVQQLLQDAQSSDKLCKMYVGWSAWL